jgi:phage repressor protein C with HTH and peptisase S24 domain
MSIRRGDRVMLPTAAGEVMVKELKWRTANSIELRSIDPRMASARSRRATCSGFARIVWASPVKESGARKSGRRKQTPSLHTDA